MRSENPSLAKVAKMLVADKLFENEWRGMKENWIIDLGPQQAVTILTVVEIFSPQYKLLAALRGS